MDYPKWRKSFKGLLVSLGRVADFSKSVALGASFLTLWANPSPANPRVPINDVPVTSIPSSEIKKYSAKYLLKSAANSRFITRLVQRHRSHSSHSSHSSHASHYSSAGTPSPRPVPNPYPAPSVSPPARRPESVVVVPVFGFRDDFSGIVRAGSRWSIGAPTIEPASVDILVSVLQINGRLEITPRAGVRGKHYNGYASTSEWDLTDAQATVEVVQTPASTASMTFALAVDTENWYGFVVENGTLYCQSKVNGVKSPKRIPYNASQHRFWRLRHDPATKLLLWETSADKVTWIINNAETPQVPLTNLYVTLSAGSYQLIKQPGTAVFDNFQLVRNP